ncbi:MAG: flavin-containing monooxygenase [Candidatus Azotimanducaceae bacterium]
MSNNDNLQEKIDKMREKYRLEREKRLRSDGSDQFVQVKGEFSYFSEDPYSNDVSERDPREEKTDIVIVGGGFGGLLAAARLSAIGYSDITVVEEGADFGGTWYWNRYPGAQCDVESYVYMPLLEEVGSMPSEKYAHGNEIFEHSRSIGKHFGLYDKALFQTRMIDAEWNEDSSTWKVLTNRGDSLDAKFLVLATGNLTKPKLPGIPGIEKFKGHMFHTSRWDYGYTGSDGRNDLTALRDKRVAIIGVVLPLSRWFLI